MRRIRSPRLSHADSTGSSSAVALTAAPPPPAPDLAVSNVVAPAELVSGQTLAVSYTISNLGAATTGSWYDAVYLSRNQVLGSNGDVYLGYLSDSGLAAGAQQTETQSFVVPQGQAGPFWVIVVADSGDALPDSDRSNNAGVSGGVQVDLPPVADLNVGVVSVPATATVGQMATITYTVDNLNGNAEQGSWYDALYLTSDGTWSVGDPLLGEVLHTGGIAAYGSYTGTLTAQLPGVAPGNYQVVVRTDILDESAGTNVTGVSSGSITMGTPTLTLGTPASGTLATGGLAYYQLVVVAGQTVNLSLTSDNPNAINNIYVRYGAVPTLGQFDVTSSNPAVADPDAVIPVTQPGTYYVMVAGNSVNGTEDYTLNVQALEFSISHITPDYGSNLGSVTLTIDGAQFNADEQVAVIAPDGTVRDAASVSWVNGTEVWANFNLTGLAVGTYDVQISDGSRSATLAQAFQVTNGPTGEVSVNLVLPQYLRAGQTGVVQVDYSNTGQTDVAAPIIDLSTAQALLNGGVAGGSGDIVFLGTNSSGPAGMLQPGAQGSVSFSYTPINPQPHELINFSAGVLDPAVTGSGAIDWSGFWSSVEGGLLPPTVDSTDWSNIWNDFLGLVGTTTANVQSALSAVANELSQIGQPTNDINALLQFELLQASGGMVGTNLIMATDIRDAASSLKSLAHPVLRWNASQSRFGGRIW